MQISSCIIFLIFAFWDSVVHFFIINRNNQNFENNAVNGQRDDGAELLPLEFVEEEKPSAPRMYQANSIVIPQYHRIGKA